MSEEGKLLQSASAISEKTLYEQVTGVLDKISLRIATGLLYVAGALIGILMILTFSDVFLRYIFNNPLGWIYDLTMIFLLITIYFSLPYLGIKKGNISITVITEKLGLKARSVLSLITDLASFVTLLLITWQGIAQIIATYGTKDITSDLKFPIYFTYIFLSIGCFAYCIVLLKDYLTSISKIRLNMGRQMWLWLGLSLIIGLLLIFSPVWYHTLDITLTSSQVALFGLLLFIVLLFLGMSIAFGMALAGYLGLSFLISSGAGLNLLKTIPQAASMNYTLSVIPLFILMGLFAFHSGIINDLFYGISKFVGRLPGGLLIATTTGCAGFAAVCGSSLASGAAMSTICYNELKKYNYDSAISAGCIALGGTLGIMIPPSLDFIIYGVLTMTSIGTLFIAGVIPGILMASFFIITALVLCLRNPNLAPPVPEKYSLKEKMSGFYGFGPILVLFLIVIGGIYLGVFTPTESAGIGSFGALVIALIRKKLRWKSLLNSLNETVEMAAMISIIFIGAMILGYFMALTKVPTELATFLAALPLNRWLIIVMIMLMYVIAGCFISPFATMIITVPIIFPAIKALGFDSVWYGVLMIAQVELGSITPPVGMMVFVVSGVTKLPVATVFRGAMPFLIADFIAVALIMAFPQISLTLPTLMSH